MKFDYFKPISKARPRLGKYGVYDSQSAEKSHAKWHLKMQMLEKSYLKLPEEPIEVALRFHMAIPRSSSSKQINALEGEWCCKGKDLDNMAKFFLDVLNKLAYEDDRLIARLVCEKVYGKDEKVEIFLRKLNAKKEKPRRKEEKLDDL